MTTRDMKRRLEHLEGRLLGFDGKGDGDAPVVTRAQALEALTLQAVWLHREGHQISAERLRRLVVRGLAGVRTDGQTARSVRELVAKWWGPAALGDPITPDNLGDWALELEREGKVPQASALRDMLRDESFAREASGQHPSTGH